MKKSSIFLQNGFWQEIKSADNKNEGPDTRDIFRVMHSSRVQAEVPINLFLQDEYLNIIWQESGGSCFLEQGQIDTILEKEGASGDFLSSVFLLEKNEKDCKKYENKKGLLCINAKMLSRDSYMISQKTISYDFHEEGSYDDLKKWFQHPCNSLILIDPYILNEKLYIRNYIKPLLTNILPESLEVQFHLSIFSGIGRTNNDEVGDSFLNEIDDMLHKIRPKINFSLSVYQIPRQGDGWHDRLVITNNAIIEASSGFDFFSISAGKMKSRRIGSFKISFPCLNINRDVDIYNIWIKKTAKESLENGGKYQHGRWGTQENRLFDLII